MKSKKKYRVDDGFNGDKWTFATIEKLREFGDYYTEICEGDWMPIYRVYDQELGKYRVMTLNEENNFNLPH